MGSAAQYGLVMAMVGGFTSLATLIVEIVFIVVVASVVRRERPDAWLVLLGSFVCDVVALLVGSAGAFAMPLVLGPGDMMYALAGVNLFATLLRVAARGLIIVGLVRLARPPAAAPPWP